MLLLLPFIKYIALMMQKIVPIVEEKTDIMYEKKLVYLVDQLQKKSPSMAVMNAHMEICRMWKIANENLDLSMQAFFEKSTEKAKKVFENEKIVDYLHQSITAALVEVNNLQLSGGDAKKVSDMFVILSEIEQIGDRAENIAEYVMSIVEESMEFSDESIEEMKAAYAVTKELMTLSLNAYDKQKRSSLPKIKELEDKVDEMEFTFTKNHFNRLKEKQCNVNSGVVFTDTISDLEKCADSAEKIAFLME